MPELDYTTIATTVSRVIEDTDLRGELIRRGLENVQRFSRERTAKSFLAALDSGLRLEPTKSLVRRRRWSSLFLRQRVRLMQIAHKVTQCVVQLLRPEQS